VADDEEVPSPAGLLFRSAIVREPTGIKAGNMGDKLRRNNTNTSAAVSRLPDPCNSLPSISLPLASAPSSFSPLAATRSHYSQLPVFLSYAGRWFPC
jgi:hypothetical protein